MSNLIQHVLGFRVEIDTQYAVLLGYRKSAREAFARLHAAQARFNSECGSPVDHIELDRLYRHTDEQYRELEALEDKHLQRVEELGRLEFKLSERERAAHVLLERLLSAEPDFGLESALLQEDNHSVNSLTTEYAEPDPQLVLDFYDRTGDRRIYRDRLHDLDYEHLREKGLRQARKERGESVEPPDDQFYGEHFRQRWDILLNLTRAAAEARDLKRQCEERGYALESNSSDSEDASPLDQSRRVHGPQRHTYAVFHGGPYAGVNPLETLLFGPVNKQSVIEAWLRGVRAATRPRIAWSDSRRSASAHLPSSPELRRGEPVEDDRVDAKSDRDALLYSLDRVTAAERRHSPRLEAQWQPEAIKRRYSLANVGGVIGKVERDRRKKKATKSVSSIAGTATQHVDAYRDPF